MTSSKTRFAANPTVAFIGFGEAAAAFVKGWGDSGPGRIFAFDIKTEGKSREQKRAEYESAGVTGCDSVGDAVADADIIFSLVTPDQTLVAAQSVADGLREGCLFLDGNSCAPETKRKAAIVIGNAGGRYVDVAIMSPVHPAVHMTPVLTSGPSASVAVEAMIGLGMAATKVEGDIGAASSVKMVRSIMVKGLEALVAECILAGHMAGVSETVLASLEKSHPGFGWTGRAAYVLERMMEHGERRAAEMREVVKMAEGLGVGSDMSRATEKWQRTIGELALNAGQGSYQLRAKAIADAIAAAGKTTKGSGS